jgi:hypothetical protein
MYYQFWAFTGDAEAANGYFPGISPVNLISLAITLSLAYEQWVSANPGLEIGGQIYDDPAGVYQYTVVAGTVWGGLTPQEVVESVDLVPDDLYIEGDWHSQFGAAFNPRDAGYPDMPAWVGTPQGTVFMNTGDSNTCVLTGPSTVTTAGVTITYTRCN